MIFFGSLFNRHFQLCLIVHFFSSSVRIFSVVFLDELFPIFISFYSDEAAIIVSQRGLPENKTTKNAGDREIASAIKPKLRKII